MPAIKADNVAIGYRTSNLKVDTIKEYVIRNIRRQLTTEYFWALDGVSFELEQGASLGVVGLNGSGKSTLLKTIAGILEPTKGTVVTNGSIAPLIELGAGFDMDLTAHENIYLNGALLGHNRAFMDKHIHEIVNFAELHDFLNVPLKNFSSGMVSRLGFSVATMSQPDILILDEVLSVGDYKFQKKSLARTQEIIDNGATVVFVSHAVAQVRKICDYVLWLDHGKTVMFGTADEVLPKYQETDEDSEGPDDFGRAGNG